MAMVFKDADVGVKILDNRIFLMVEKLPACNFIRSFATDGIKVVTTGKRKFMMIADRLGKITDYKKSVFSSRRFFILSCSQHDKRLDKKHVNLLKELSPLTSEIVSKIKRG